MDNFGCSYDILAAIFSDLPILVVRILTELGEKNLKNKPDCLNYDNFIKYIGKCFALVNISQRKAFFYMRAIAYLILKC